MIFSLRLSIIILILFFSSNSQILFGQNASPKKYKEDFVKIKTDGVVFVNTEKKAFDSGLKLGLETAWDVSKYDIVDASEISNLKKDNYILTTISLKLEDRFGERSDELLVVVPQSLLNEDDKILKSDPMILSTLNIFGGDMSKSDFKHILPYAIGEINDCIEMIIANPSVGSMEGIHELINKKNGFRTKDKTILFIKGAFTQYIRFEQLDKEGIKYELVTMSEYEDMTNETLADYVLAAFGGNTGVTFSLHDPISKDLLYTKNYYSGYLGKKRIREMQKYY